MGRQDCVRQQVPGQKLFLIHKLVGDALRYSFWGKASQESERGNITDDGSLDLAGSGINATGAMAILNIGSFDTYVRKVFYFFQWSQHLPISYQVLSHQPGSPSFTYNDDLGNIHWNPRFNQYYFEAAFDLLDNPGEWFFDVATNILHLIPPSGACPSTSSTRLRGRTLDYGLTITNTSGLTVANLTFLAATIDGHSEDRGPYIDEIRLDSVDFLFPSSSHRMLGSDSLPKVLWFLYSARSLTFCLGNLGNQAVRVLKHAASQDPWTCPGGQIKTWNISKVKR